MLGYYSIIATLYMANSLPSARDQDLTLGGKPEVHPER